MSEESPESPEQKLSFLIQTLQSAQTRAYSLSSSPVEPLIEVMVDLALELSKELKAGRVFWELRSNKILEFSKTQVDVLSNPKVIQRTVQRHRAWSPQLSNFFGKLAEDLILVKRTHKLPEHLYYSCKPGKRDRQKGQKLKASVYHFHRRRSQKSKRN